MQDEEKEAYREGKIEDKLEGELAELLEEDVAEHYETRPHERQARSSGAQRR